MFIGMALGLFTAISWLTLVLVLFGREVDRYEAMQGTIEGRGSLSFVDSHRG